MLFYHFLDMPVAQRVIHIPSDADQNDVDRETHSFEVTHIDSSSVHELQLTRTVRPRRQCDKVRIRPFTKNTKIYLELYGNRSIELGCRESLYGHV